MCWMPCPSTSRGSWSVPMVRPCSCCTLLYKSMYGVASYLVQIFCCQSSQYISSPLEQICRCLLMDWKLDSWSCIAGVGTIKSPPKRRRGGHPVIVGRPPKRQKALTESLKSPIKARCLTSRTTSSRSRLLVAALAAQPSISQYWRDTPQCSAEPP